MPPQLINVKGQTLLLINKKNDNVINCFIPQRDIKIDDSNYQTYPVVKVPDPVQIERIRFPAVTHSTFSYESS